MAPLDEGRSSGLQPENQNDREAHQEQSDSEPSAGPAWYYEMEQDEDDEEDADYQDEPDEDDEDGFQGMLDLNESICRASSEKMCRCQRWPPV